MRRLCIDFTLFLLLLLLALPARAVHSREKQSLLVVHQETGTVDTESPSGRVIDTKTLAEKTTYEEDPGETLVVQIADPNPLLYIYSWKLSPKTPTANFTVLSDFRDSLKSLVTLLPKAQSSQAGGLVADSANSSMKAMTEALQFAASTAPTATDRMESALSLYALQLDQLIKEADLIPNRVRRSAESYSEAESVKNETAGLPALLDEFEKNLALLAELESEVLKDPVQSADVLKDLGDVKRDAAKTQELLKTLRSFANLAKTIHVPITLDPSVMFDSTQDSGGKLTIAVQDDKNAKEAAPKANAKGKPGTYEFVVIPYSPVDFAVGPAAIYSFIELQNYGTLTENGKTTIVRKDSGDEVNGLTVGAMLSITPRAWSNPAFHGSIQVGASPTKDKVGLFLGGAVRFFDLLSIGGGIAYQQAQRLAPGLTVGQEIASADKLKTKAIYKSGFYLTVTLDFGRGK